MQTAAPNGFATGSEHAAGGGAFSGALVSTPSLSIVALSATTGGYVAASGTGALTLTALDLQTSDTATGTSTIPNPGGVVPLNLQLVSGDDLFQRLNGRVEIAMLLLQTGKIRFQFSHIDHRDVPDCPSPPATGRAGESMHLAILFGKTIALTRGMPASTQREPS